MVTRRQLFGLLAAAPVAVVTAREAKAQEAVDFAHNVIRHFRALRFDSADNPFGLANGTNPVGKSSFLFHRSS